MNLSGLTRHVMVDLETMGKRPTAAIASIGAVAFVMPTMEQPGVLYDEFYMPVDLQSCLDAGLDVDASTIYWWLQQSDEARAALGNEKNSPIRDACQAFTHFFQAVGAEYIWANGTDFDVSILKVAYGKLGLRLPFKYNAGRDMRSYCETLNVWPDKTNWIGAHNALDDARNQAQSLIDIAYNFQKERYNLLLLRRKAAGHEDPADAILERAVAGQFCGEATSFPKTA